MVSGDPVTPVKTSDDLKPAVASALGRLWAYLKTWQHADGRIGGMVATWWSSTAGWAGPHPMNEAPVILGLLTLAERGVGGADWQVEASRIGDGLLRVVGREGVIDGAWGDIPGKPTGPILHVAPAEALAELFRATGQGKYLDAAVRILRLVDRRWGRGARLFHQVVNQELRWAQALLAAAGVMKDADWREHARAIGQAVMADGVDRGDPQGAFHQGGRDDKLILVYVGKCLGPLLLLHRTFGDRVFLDRAVRLADYLLSRTVEPGVFLNYEAPSQRWTRYHYLEALAYRLTGSSRPFTHWRRRRIADWRTYPFPSFVARAGDAVRALWTLADTLPAYHDHAVALTRRILAGQLEHGGIRNAFGWEGDPGVTHWQDVICPTRWNGYAFHLLCDVAGRLGIPRIAIPEDKVSPCRREIDGTLAGTFYEDDVVVKLTRAESTLFEIAKTTGTVHRVEDGLAGEATGARSMVA